MKVKCAIVLLELIWANGWMNLACTKDACEVRILMHPAILQDTPFKIQFPIVARNHATYSRYLCFPLNFALTFAVAIRVEKWSQAGKLKCLATFCKHSRKHKSSGENQEFCVNIAQRLNLSHFIYTCLNALSSICLFSMSSIQLL